MKPLLSLVVFVCFALIFCFAVVSRRWTNRAADEPLGFDDDE